MQHNPLLGTKFYIPPNRPELISRPRLIERLNTGLHRKLTLLSAPAGFGKTSLLSECVTLCKQPVAWVSLDEGDDDLNRFLVILVTALQRVEAAVGQFVMPALQSQGTVNEKAVLTLLLNDIADIPDDFILVLDDYHVIESQEIDHALGFMLDHLPQHMHLIISSRTDPSLPLSRLRARGQLTELRMADLRFTLDEAADYFKNVLRLPIAIEDVQSLINRTEGWITGLQLATVAMQGLEQSDRIRSFVQDFSGTHRYVIDYLVDEVLSQQTSEMQLFLLQTSVLSRLFAPLCNVVVNREDCQDILEALEAANLFLIPLDNKRSWYRYHHLFGELLSHHLRRTFPETIPELHQRASTWYEAEGLTGDAIHHAQAAGNPELVARILEEHWQEMIHRGELVRLRQMLDVLGIELTKKSAPLSMAYCWIHHLTGENDALPGYIADTREALKPEIPPQTTQKRIELAVIPSLIETMESVVSLRSGQAATAKAHAQQAIALIPDDLEPASRGLLHGAAGYRLADAHRKLGESDQACAVLLEILDILKVSQNCLGVANAVWLITNMYQESGKIKQAIMLCENTLDYIREQHWEQMPSSGMIYLVLASLQVDSGDREVARRNLESGQRLIEPLSSPEVFKLADRVKKKLGRTALSSQPLVEPLSGRELEVLELLAYGYTNREICEKLFLALDTIKGHNRNIYGKLGVKNRTQAVNKAVSLKIIHAH